MQMQYTTCPPSEIEKERKETKSRLHDPLIVKVALEAEHRVSDTTFVTQKRIKGSLCNIVYPQTRHVETQTRRVEQLSR